MTRDEFIAFVRARRLAVVATVSPQHHSESALVGVAITPRLELVFDTSTGSRKAVNLRANPHASLVVGWDDETTLQCEGFADEPDGEALERCKAAYFESFPDGRERGRSPEITYFRVRPSWARYCSFGASPPEIVEIAISDDAFAVQAGKA